MKIDLSRRSLLALGAGLSTAALIRPTAAAQLAVPTGKVILTISGVITRTNRANTAIFDRPMLEALGISSIDTKTPWYAGQVHFEGVKMEDLMQQVGATGQTVTAVALNDYSSEIPFSDFSRYGVLLALKRGGAYMPVSDKGPLFIVYPYDSSPDLQSQKFYSRSAWQVSRMIIT